MITELQLADFTAPAAWEHPEARAGTRGGPLQLVRSKSVEGFA